MRARAGAIDIVAGKLGERGCGGMGGILTVWGWGRAVESAWKGIGWVGKTLTKCGWRKCIEL